MQVKLNAVNFDGVFANPKFGPEGGMGIAQKQALGGVQGYGLNNQGITPQEM